MNGADCLLETLVTNGVDLCLMNPGTSELEFVSALDRVKGMRGVLCLFEGVCAAAADGYSRMTGRPAATLFHTGPGLGNALAYLHNARKARSPMVVIVGQHTAQHLAYESPLKSDIAGIARPVSGWVREIDSAAAIAEAASAAVTAAVGPPGQIATLIVPADCSWSEAGDPGPLVPRPARRAPRRECVAEAARILRAGESAGLFLSGSALTGRGLEAAGRLASTGVRVLTNRFFNRMERGRNRFAPERIPYFPEMAQPMLAGLKHLILVEAEPPVSFFGYRGLRSLVAPEDCLYHELASAAEDGQAALEMLAQECGATRPAFVERERPPVPSGSQLTPALIGQAVAALLPEGAIVSDEAVSSGEAISACLDAAAPHDFLAVTGGAIGQGLPLAVGAALACPDRKVVALEGDGSGMYTLQSLWTMARERLDVVSVILANRRYRVLGIEMERTGSAGKLAGEMIDIGRPELDWVKLAEGMGVAATRAATATEFAAQFGAAMRERGPRLIEAICPAAPSSSR
jgi:acetolactate synthase-1/2/3 large subunit